MSQDGSDAAFIEGENTSKKRAKKRLKVFEISKRQENVCFGKLARTEKSKWRAGRRSQRKGPPQCGDAPGCASFVSEDEYSHVLSVRCVDGFINAETVTQNIEIYVCPYVCHMMSLCLFLCLYINTR